MDKRRTEHKSSIFRIIAIIAILIVVLIYAKPNDLERAPYLQRAIKALIIRLL